MKIEHKIEIIETLPKPSPIFKFYPSEDEMLKKHLIRSLGKNLIRVSKSLFGEAVLFVKKKDGFLRLITNYCTSNAVTKIVTFYLISVNC